MLLLQERPPFHLQYSHHEGKRRYEAMGRKNPEEKTTTSDEEVCLYLALLMLQPRHRSVLS